MDENRKRFIKEYVEARGKDELSEEEKKALIEMTRSKGKTAKPEGKVIDWEKREREQKDTRSVLDHRNPRWTQGKRLPKVPARLRRPTD